MSAGKLTITRPLRRISIALPFFMLFFFSTCVPGFEFHPYKYCNDGYHFYCSFELSELPSTYVEYRFEQRCADGGRGVGAWGCVP